MRKIYKGLIIHSANVDLLFLSNIFAHDNRIDIMLYRMVDNGSTCFMAKILYAAISLLIKISQPLRAKGPTLWIFAFAQDAVICCPLFVIVLIDALNNSALNNSKISASFTSLRSSKGFLLSVTRHFSAYSFLLDSSLGWLYSCHLSPLLHSHEGIRPFWIIQSSLALYTLFVGVTTPVPLTPKKLNQVWLEKREGWPLRGRALFMLILHHLIQFTQTGERKVGDDRRVIRKPYSTCIYGKPIIGYAKRQASHSILLHCLFILNSFVFTTLALVRTITAATTTAPVIFYICVYLLQCK